MLIGLGLQSLRKGVQIRRKENAKKRIDAEKKKADEAQKKIEEKDPSVQVDESVHGKSLGEIKPPMELEVIDFSSALRP